MYFDIFAAGIGLTAIFLLALRFHNLEGRIHAQEERIAKLEEAAVKRVNYRTQEEIMDAIAALVKEKSEREFYDSLIDNALGHLQNAMAVGTKREK